MHVSIEEVDLLIICCGFFYAAQLFFPFFVSNLHVYLALCVLA